MIEKDKNAIFQYIFCETANESLIVNSEKGIGFHYLFLFSFMMQQILNIEKDLQ